MLSLSRSTATAWDVKELGTDFRSSFQSHRPVLILCGDLDARTPLENAREILEGLPSGRLAVIEGGGHGFRPSSKVLALVGSSVVKTCQLSSELPPIEVLRSAEFRPASQGKKVTTANLQI